MKKTESSGLGSSEEVKERERDVVGEMVEAILAASRKAIEYRAAHKWKSSAMASGRERDVAGEMEEKDDVDQIEEYLKRALMLIKICKECTAMSSAMASGRTQIQAPESDTKNLQLRLSSSLSDIFYTGERKLGSEIHVELIDKITGNVVTSGPESCAKLNVVVVKGNFDNNDRTREDFRSHVVTDRVEKKLLTGAVELFLEDGVALLPVPTFTDNSSWIQNKKIRLGVEVASGFCEGIRVREAISNPFVVKDCRGKGNEKHYPPAPDDEVWRLRNIARNGQFHMRLNAVGISKVRHFLWKLYKDPQGLMEILETKMAPGRWDDLVEHAKTCVLSGKYYVYYADATKNFGVVFENVFESCGLIEGGEYYSAENLSDSQKVSVETLIRDASDNKCDRWKSIVEYHVSEPSDMKPRKRARLSPTDVATGAHTDQQVREPAIGDPHVPSDQQVLVPGQPPSDPYFNRGQYSKAGDGPATSSDPSEQANGNISLPVEGDGPATSSDPSEQANGNTALPVEACKKRQDPLGSDDEVWRLDTIIENGHFHDRLNKAGIFKVREFLWKLGRDRQGLREILGTTMTDGNWETLVEHAETCDLSGKSYVYYVDAMSSSGVVFENVFESCGLIEGGVYYSAENLTESQKVSADNLIIEARDNECDRWKSIVKYHDPMLLDGAGDLSLDSESVFDFTTYDPPNLADGTNEWSVEDVEPLLQPAPDPPNLADGTEDLSFEWKSFLDFTTDDEPPLPPAPDPPNLADGTNELSVEDHDGAIDMNPSEREHFPPTDSNLGL